MRPRTGSTCSALSLVALTLLGCGGGVQVVTESRELPPADPRAVRLLVQGARFIEQDNLRQARNRLERAIELDPNLWEAHYNLGVVERRLGRLLQASDRFAAARRIQPGAVDPLLAQAEVYYLLGEREEASVLLETVVERDPDRVPARVALATILRERGETDAALRHAREALIREPANVRALAEVGRVYVARENYEVAQLVLRKALELMEDEDPVRAEIYNDLGLLELARGDTQEAFRAFAQAIEADPRYTPARKNQGSVLLHAGDYEGARDEYQAVLRIDEADHDARVALAIALRGLGRHEGARRHYERVLEESPNHLGAVFNLAILRAEFLEQRPQSRELFVRFMELAPRNHPRRAMAQQYLDEIPAPGGEP